MHTGVIIVAGGSGRRVGGSIPKQFRLLGGMPVLARTINLFAETLPGAEIVAVLPGEHIAFWRDLAARFDVAKHSVAAGGSERFHSVKHGIDALKSFLISSKLKHLIRAHQCVYNGVEKLFHGKIYTVFSSSSYSSIANKAGILKFNNDIINPYNFVPIPQLKTAEVNYKDFASKVSDYLITRKFDKNYGKRELNI